MTLKTVEQIFIPATSICWSRQRLLFMAILVLLVKILYSFQLTFGPFDPVLTEGNQFSSLYQVAPKDTALTHGIASLMLHFSWNWVGVLISSDHRGAQILSDLRRELDRNGVCIAFVETVSFLGESLYYNSVHTKSRILESSANVIVIYGDSTSFLTVIVNKWGKFISRFVWVMNSKWGGNRFHEYTMLDSFHGSLIFSPHHGEILGFIKFMQEATPAKYPEDIYLHILWNIYFNCSLLHSNCQIFENCLPNASLGLLPGNIFDMTMTEESYNVYNAAYAVAHSLHEMILSQVQDQTEANKDITLPFSWQVMSLLLLCTIRNRTPDSINAVDLFVIESCFSLIILELILNILGTRCQCTPMPVYTMSVGNTAQVFI